MNLQSALRWLSGCYVPCETLLFLASIPPLIVREGPGPSAVSSGGLASGMNSPWQHSRNIWDLDELSCCILETPEREEFPWPEHAHSDTSHAGKLRHLLCIGPGSRDYNTSWTCPGLRELVDLEASKKLMDGAEEWNSSMSEHVQLVLQYHTGIHAPQSCLQAAGASILEALAGQRQQLQHAQGTNKQAQANLDKSQSILKRFW